MNESIVLFVCLFLVVAMITFAAIFAAIWVLIAPLVRLVDSIREWLNEDVAYMRNSQQIDKECLEMSKVEHAERRKAQEKSLATQEQVRFELERILEGRIKERKNSPLTGI